MLQIVKEPRKYCVLLPLQIKSKIMSILVHNIEVWIYKTESS